MKIEIRQLGRLRYNQALEIMNEIHTNIVTNAEFPNTILVVEHPPVVTMGQRFLVQDMKVDESFLTNAKVDFAKIDRGGSVTVHEPGQVVVYPLIRLDSQQLTVKKFVWILEQAMINVAKNYEVACERNPVNAGVWVGNKKLGAIGIRVANKVAKHGLAMNVINTLETFHFITPCGLKNSGVTSLKKEMPSHLSPPPVSDIGREIAEEIVSMLVNVVQGQSFFHSLEKAQLEQEQHG